MCLFFQNCTFVLFAFYRKNGHLVHAKKSTSGDNRAGWKFKWRLGLFFFLFFKLPTYG